jgi:hypothetical protein
MIFYFSIRFSGLFLGEAFSIWMLIMLRLIKKDWVKSCVDLAKKKTRWNLLELNESDSGWLTLFLGIGF